MRNDTNDTMRGVPAWMQLARSEIGTHEVSGDSDNPAIMAYYRDAGHPEIAHESTAWCAAASCSWLERSGVASPKTLSARDFLRWGKKLDKPKIGCICVFSRGDPRAYTGHVGLYAGEEGDNILVLGGNQSDAVSITRMPKSSLLGYRWPVTATNSRTNKAVAVGTVGTTLVTLAPSAPSLISMGGEFKALGSTSTAFAFIGAALCIIAFIAIIYARQSDAAEKGR